MSPADPKFQVQRMHDALDLLVANAEDDVGRARARITALVASVAADAQALVERSKCDGPTPQPTSGLGVHLPDP